MNDPIEQHRRPLDHRRPRAATATRSPSPPRRSRASRTSSSGRSRACPRCGSHNPVLAYENGDEFMQPLSRRRRRRGSTRSSSWSRARSRTRRTSRRATGPASASIDATGQPITTCEWIDRLAPQAWAVVAAGTCATYGGIHAMAGNPTGAMGLADYLGWQWQSKAGIPIVCVPGCPVQPDNFMETLLYLLRQAAGTAPMIPLDDALRPTWLFAQTVHEGCDRGGYYEQADFAAEYGSQQVHREARLLGAGGAVQRRQARLDERHRRLPQRRRRLHRLHDARLPRQVHAVHGRAARARRCRPRPSSCTAARCARCATSPRRRSTSEPAWRQPRRRSRGS